MIPLSIVEVDGLTALDLEGSALPAQGVAMGSELRMVSTYYPGNAAPSVQILGTQEDEIPLRGVWRDDLLGLVDGAMALVSTARKLQQGQRRCRMVWGDVTRYGYVKAFKPTIRRRDFVEWELTFFVDQADDALVLAVPAAPNASNLALLAAISAAETVIDEVAEVVVAVNNVLQAAA